MYVKPGPDADASDPFDAMPSKQFGAAVAIPDGALNVDPASTLDLGDYVQYNDIPEATMTVITSYSIHYTKLYDRIYI